MANQAFPLSAAAPAVPLRALRRLSRRLDRREPDTGWAPPPLPELIARIDLALAARRRG